MKKNKRNRICFEKCLDGMVELRIQAIHTEDLLSLMAMHQIPLSQVYRTEKDIFFTIRLDDFRVVQNLLRKQRWRFYICSKQGVPFFISGLKRRKGVWVGLVCCTVLGHFLLSCLWGYEVTGNERYSDEHIIALVQQYGLSPGCRLDHVDYETLEHEIELNHPEFTWMQFETNGTTLCISVKERLADTADVQTTGSIVAKTDAKITMVRTYTGTVYVQEGDWVTADQVLIGGWAYPERVRNIMGEFVDVGTPYPVRAKGEIWGEREYRAIGVCALDEISLQYTGQEKRAFSFLWREKVLCSVGTKTSPYTYSETSENIKSLFQWGKWDCPVKIREVIYREKRVLRHSYTEEEAYQIAIERARRQIQQRIPQSGHFVRENEGIYRSLEYGVIQAVVVWVVEEPLGEIKQIPLPDAIYIEANTT